MSTPPKLLSQQIAAWLLKAMGVVASHRAGDTRGEVSASTIKSGLAGRPILRSWATLHTELLALLGATPTEEQVGNLSTLLHTWDQRVSRMDTRGLDRRSLLPALLRAAAPALGVRFGALAALARPKSTPDLPVSDWLCDPLSPATFGRTVEALFARHRPELTTWTTRYAAMNTIDRTTVEDWRSETLIRIPNPSNITTVAEALGNNPTALTTLRIARALTVLRHELSDDPDLAGRFAEAVRLHAELTRKLLCAPAELAAFAEHLAVGLDGPHGEAFAAKLRLSMPGPATPPAELAVRIRSLAASVRERGVVDELAWLQVITALEPHPALVGIVGMNLGIPFEVSLHEPLDLIEKEWTSLWFLRRVADGVPMGWSDDGVRPETRPASEPLRLFAQALYEEQCRICRRPEDPPIEPHGVERLMLSLFSELGGEPAVHATVRSFNEVARTPALPAEAERVLDEAALAAFPAWMAERARRVAHAGHDAEARDWIARWAQSAAPRAEPERRAVAEAAVTMAHRLIDGVRRQREFLAMELPCPWEALPVDLADQLSETIANCERLLNATLEGAHQLWQIASGVWSADAGTPSEVDRLVLLMPLALRIDLLTSDATGEEPYLNLAEPLADRLQAQDRALPDHGPAWAMRALWHRVIGDDDSLPVRWATHWGSLSAYQTEVARLVADHALTQSTR